MPDLFQEFFQASKASAAADTLQRELVREHAFTEAGACKFVASFKATMAAAGLSGSAQQFMAGKVTEGCKQPVLGLGSSRSLVYRRYGERIIPLPLSPTKWVNLVGSFPVTEDEWELMIKVLQEYKAGLVLSTKNKQRPNANVT